MQQYYQNYKEATFMNLYGLLFQTIQLSQQFENLNVLNLSFNKLTGIRALQCCPNIAKLDLSYNLLTNVDYITDLKKLEVLYLHFNNIANLKLLEDFNYLTHLKDLRIRGNPIAIEIGYRYPIVQMLTNIRILDQVVITKLDREGLNQNYNRITMEMILEKVKNNSKFEGMQGNWKVKVEILDLSHCNLVTLENLYELENLRIAIFSNNKIKKIENLINNTKLGISLHFLGLILLI